MGRLSWIVWVNSKCNHSLEGVRRIDYRRGNVMMETAWSEGRLRIQEATRS
jgi:hypothetical protein